MTTDDKLNARQTILQEDWMEFEAVAAINFDEVATNLLTHDRVVTVTRDIDQHGGKTAKAVKTRDCTNAWALAKSQDQFGIGCEAFCIDLEKFITRIFFQHIHKRLAGMVFTVEAKMLDNRISLGTDERNTGNRADIGNGCEQTNETQLANRVAIRPKNLHANIVEVRAAMHQ